MLQETSIFQPFGTSAILRRILDVLHLNNSLSFKQVSGNPHTPVFFIWTASSEFGTYRLCEQRRFRRACASAQSRQNLSCSLIEVVSQEEPSDRKPNPWPLWMAGHAQFKFVMTECSKTQIRLTGPIWQKKPFKHMYHVVNQHNLANLIFFLYFYFHVQPSTSWIVKVIHM